MNANGVSCVHLRQRFGCMGSQRLQLGSLREALAHQSYSNEVSSQAPHLPLSARPSMLRGLLSLSPLLASACLPFKKSSTCTACGLPHAGSCKFQLSDQEQRLAGKHAPCLHGRSQALLAVLAAPQRRRLRRPEAWLAPRPRRAACTHRPARKGQAREPQHTLNRRCESWAGVQDKTCWLQRRAGLLRRCQTRLLTWYEAASCAGATGR